MDWVQNKFCYRFIYACVCIVSAFIAVSPGVIAIFIPEELTWMIVLMLPITVGQIFFVATPITNVLSAYKEASGKRGLIHEQDIYKLFEKNGTAKLHVGDIDQLPRYNVEIPETKFQLFTENIPVVVDEAGTEKMVNRGYTMCLNCKKTFSTDIIEDEDFKHCPCCGNRIVRYRVPKDWFESRKGFTT